MRNTTPIRRHGGIQDMRAASLRGTAIAAVGLGLSLLYPAMAAAQTGAWQVHQGAGRFNLGGVLPNGDNEGFLKGAQIPAQADGGWSSASTDLSLRWAGPGGVPCRAQANYAYFQTVLRPTDGQSYGLAFANVDDVVRVTVFNALNPNGLNVPGGIVQLRENKTVDLTGSLAPGMDNRVVLTLADVCGAGHGLTVQVKATPGGAATTAPTGADLDADTPAAARLAQTNTGALTLAPAPAEGARRGGPVVFASTDGSASIGSRSVFMVRNTATGQTTLVPVLGNGSSTRTVAYLAPGNYTVTPPPPSVGQFSTFTAKNVSATQLTVPASAVNADRPIATVTFSVEAQRSPVVMLVSDVTANSLQLNWGAGQGVEVGQYVLVRTDGTTPAANPNAGTRVALSSATATSATVRGLAPNRKYTFTLFATSRSGEALPVRTYTVSTSNPGSNAAAFAVAANTIMPTDFASLRAERIGEHWVRVTLDPSRLQRGSGSAMPGLESAAVQGGGCVVGTPFLAATDIAGNNAFYGVIDACESNTQGVSKAIINTDVPLSTVFSYYHLASRATAMCFDPVTGAELPANAAQCSGKAPTAPPRLTATPPQGAGAAVLADLKPPEAAGTGEVQVTLLWASDDDLDLHVGDPTGGAISWHAPTSASGGKLDIDDRGGECKSGAERAENVFWSTNAPRGMYMVDVRNYRACSTPAVAKVQVRAGGKLIIDQIFRVGVDSPIVFELGADGAKRVNLSDLTTGRTLVRNDAVLQPTWVDREFAALDGNRSSLLTPAVYHGAPPPMLLASTSKRTIGGVEISCESSGSAYFDLGAHFGPHFEHDLEVDGGKLTWDIEAGVTAGINPQAEFTGEVECSGEFDGKAFQLSNYPVPVNLELKPDISAKASATVSLDGPKLGLTLGIDSEGSIGAKTEWCDPWWTPAAFPCGVDIALQHRTGPLTRFERGPVEATIAGQLEFAAGVQANLGVGVKNTFVTAKTGFSMRMYPLSAELKAVVGTSNCIAGSVGAKLGVDFLAEAYILALGDELREELYESDTLAYPGAEFEVGSCPK